MYTIDQLINLLTINYPDEITYSSDIKRTFNTSTLKSFILKDIEENALKYKQKERRILLYTTSDKEEIYIQYPGKYSTGNEKYPYDFKPIACINNTNESLDLDFQSIWRILDKYITRHEDFMPIFNNLLFRLGRMINHQKKTNDYKSFLVYDDGVRVEASDNISFPMYQFVFDDSSLMESLNFHARKINVGNDVNISLEAFLYYLDSLIQIEDCKYKLDRINDTHGRINTSDSLIVIYTYHINKIDLAELLQRFVTGRGIATCHLSEYAPATDNTINITNTYMRIEKLCEQNNIAYLKKNLCLKDIETQIPSRLYLPQKHVVIVNDNLTETQQDLLQERNWKYYNIFDYLGHESDVLDSIILDSPYYFDFDFEFESLKCSMELRTTKRKISKKDYCSITPYCTFIGTNVTILNSNPSDIEISLLEEKEYEYYVKTNYNSRETLQRLLTYVKNLK